MATPQPPSNHLTFNDAVEVWILHQAGWFQHRIAANFDVNPGRINDVLKERVHVGSREAAGRKGAA
jgi:predicted XRE-type DNA-binding protein